MMSHDTNRLGTRDLASTADPAAVSRSSTSPDAGVDQTAAEPAANDADAAGSPAGAGPSSEESLLASDVSARLRRHWEGVQTRFVDAPRDAVEEADELVASVMRLLADGFADERERLEAQWGRGGDVSTEDLRVALQRYRSFFQRLLST